MRITTLVENLVYTAGLGGEHGFSALVETDTAKVLFDTGQTDLVTRNAEALGIDLAEVACAAVSHGHYDHAGGLDGFCRVNRTASVYIREGFFDPRYRVKEGRYIGVALDAKHRNRCEVVRGVKEIAPSVFLVGDVPIRNAFDTHFSNMSVEKNGSRREDRFEDEQFLCVIDRGGLVIISGCSHRGITNVMLHAEKEFGLPIRLVLGGFHLKDAPEKQTREIVSFLAASGAKALGVCHCTGVDKLAVIREACGPGVFYNPTGTVLSDDFFNRL